MPYDLSNNNLLLILPVNQMIILAMKSIRTVIPGDHDAIWTIFKRVIKSGETYDFAPDTPKSTALSYWLSPQKKCFVTILDEKIVGTYILMPNRPGLGNYICNASYMVCPDHQGQGVGKLMGNHSIITARKLGYRGFQFNFVVSNNIPAVRLWQKLGFDIVGTLPKAYHYKKKDYIDAYVMFKDLTLGTLESPERI